MKKPDENGKRLDESGKRHRESELKPELDGGDDGEKSERGFSMKISDEHGKRHREDGESDSGPNHESGDDGEFSQGSKRNRSNLNDSAVVDRISVLPKSIRARILSFIPIKTAVQTCILSKSWIDIWRFVSCLDFDIRLTFDRNYPIIFQNFVTNLLRLRDHCTDIFKVRFTHDRVPADFFTYLQTKQVQVVHIAADFGDLAPLFSFSSLRELKLSHFKWTNFYIIPIPTFVDLRCLKTLHLVSIEFQEAFHHLFCNASCPTLETLHVEHCFFMEPTEIRISFPTLRNLTLKGEHCHVTGVVISAPDLRSFNYDGAPLPIHFTDELVRVSKAFIASRFSSMNVVACTKFFRLINNVQHCELLSLSNYEGLVGGVLLRNIDLLQHVQIPFLNLKVLNIATAFYPGQLLLINTFLNNSPNLETLELEKDEKDYTSSLENTKDEQWPWIECPIPCLKMVEIRKFKGCERGIMFVKFLIRNALLLQKVRIEYDENGLKEEIVDGLETLPRVCSSIRTSTSTVLYLS